MNNYLRCQIEEIRNDRALRFYGATVALFVFVTSLHWISADAQEWIARGQEPICWPFFESCNRARMFSGSQFYFFFYFLCAASLLNSFLFLSPRKIKIAYGTLFILNFIKYGIIFLDYRFRLNQHLMAFWITFAFLFLPQKKKTIRIFILLFYFWAGILKLDQEWLSGEALYSRPWFFEGKTLVAACYYVVFLEIVLIWGLLWDRSKLAWITLLQLLLFHLFSFKIVGFFYPTLMFLILSIFPLCWSLDRDANSLAKDLYRHRIPIGALFGFSLFSFFQILPKFFPGNTAITGEGRLFALHMFDAKTSCEVNATLKLNNGMSLNKNLYYPFTHRMHCDPIVYLNRARNLCQKGKLNQSFVDLDWTLKAKRSVDADFKTVVDFKSFCSQPIHYHLFSTNDWIMKN